MGLLGIILLSSLLFFIYIFIGTALGSRALRRNALRHGHTSPTRCFHNGYSWCHGTSPALWIGGIFWPLSIPIGAGLLAGKPKEQRDEERRARELLEAEHEAKIAKHKLAEHEALDRELDLIERRKRLDAQTECLID